MKIAEIREMSTTDLMERVEAEVANYKQIDQTITQDYRAYEN